MLKRLVEEKIKAHLRSGENKILFVWGPRRSGKTTLLKKLSQEFKLPIFNFDFVSERQLFIPQKPVLSKLASEHKIILIDEVQNFPESTLALKLLHDEFGVKIVATGSSELRQKTKDFDSLAGRYKEFYCLPFSVEEIRLNSEIKKYQEADFYQELAEKFQVFGAYPEVFTSKAPEEEKIDLLRFIFESYVLKDIVSIYNLKNTKLALDILTKLALQLGNEVSLREIANSLQANVSTVANYVEIFIKNYILLPLPSFKTNLRRAVSENRKIYFYDLGIRNILVKDFRPLSLRPDKGGLWENFIISELVKKIKNENLKINLYFYREYGGREVDLVLENYKKNYWCLEIKATDKHARKIFPLPHKLMVVNEKNYGEVLTKVKG